MKTVFWTLLGNTIFCLGIVMFILPLGLITGGTTGLGLILGHYWNVPVEVTAAVFNVAMFVLAIIVLGKQFALTAVVSTFYFPIILAVLQRVEGLKNMTTDPMLGTICAGVLVGVGIGIVIRAGASTGGVDIPPLVANKLWGIPVSVGLYAVDVTILLIQIIFRDKEMILYGILLVLIYTIVMDKVLVNGKSQMQVKIVSDKYEEINEMIQKELDRGTTFLKIESGYLRKDSLAIMTVVSNREIARLDKLVLKIDPKAFMIINKVNEVKGVGFTLLKMRDN